MSQRIEGTAAVATKALLARAAYSALLRLLTPVYFARLWWRGRHEAPYRQHWGERLGRAQRSQWPDGPDRITMAITHATAHMNVDHSSWEGFEVEGGVDVAEGRFDGGDRGAVHAGGDHGDADRAFQGGIEGRAEGVRQRVAELAALVDAAGCLRCDVRRDAAREAELFEKPRHALRVLADVWIHFAVGAFKIGVFS